MGRDYEALALAIEAGDLILAGLAWLPEIDP
jgi:hypothetical protein